MEGKLETLLAPFARSQDSVSEGRWCLWEQKYRLMSQILEPTGFDKPDWLRPYFSMLCYMEEDLEKNYSQAFSEGKRVSCDMLTLTQGGLWMAGGWLTGAWWLYSSWAWTLISTTSLQHFSAPSS